jgi:hypothetical protein
MLAADAFVWKGRLSGVGSLLYWLVCLGLTLLAMLIALIDLREVRQEGRARQQSLLEDTLVEIRRRNPPTDPASREQSRNPARVHSELNPRPDGS